MAYLQEQIKILKFDKRLLESNFRSGHISQEEYKQHLASLRDVTDNAGKIVFSDHADSGEKSSAPQGANSGTLSHDPADPFGPGY
ncbi:MAG: hypothetical protein KDD33_06845 [Bdellovibrionales bacterium]|nr:hypothetical protein [Bdellovibrionales bacterium]